MRSASCVTENSIRVDFVTDRLTSAAMIALFCLCLTLFASPFKSRSQLEAENAALRQQLIILQRKVRRSCSLYDSDRLFYPVVSSVSVYPQDHHDHPARDPRRQHRAGFQRFWYWKSRSLGGVPK